MCVCVTVRVCFSFGCSMCGERRRCVCLFVLVLGAQHAVKGKCVLVCVWVFYSMRGMCDEGESVCVCTVSVC